MAVNNREPRVGELWRDPKRPGGALVERAWLIGADGPINTMCVREFGPAPNGQGMQWNSIRATDAQMQAAGMTPAEIAQHNAAFVQHTTATKQPTRANYGATPRRSGTAKPGAGKTTRGSADVYATRRAELQAARGRDVQTGASPSMDAADPEQVYAQRMGKSAELLAGNFPLVKPAWRNSTE